MFCVGVYSTGEKYVITNSNLTQSGIQEEYIGVIEEKPEIKINSLRFPLTIRHEKRGKCYADCKEEILCYVPKDSTSLLLNAGDVLIFRTTISEVDVTGNPYEFDFKKYLSYQGIRYSAFIDEHSWQCVAHRRLPILQLWANDLRDKLLTVFSEANLSGNELGVAAALLVGDKTNLDNEIKQAYVASGTMHILAVSGMHVALLYWVLNMLFSFLDRNRYSRVLKLILLLGSVWLYAMITGLGGSILRASVMITFVIIGKASKRHINIFNSLAASAFLILIINPYSLADAGFQLSYAAVLSIIIFYPIIYRILDIENWLGDQIWSLMAVTLSAQVLTSPISLFYFHQFPNLFLISNLIMIPLSTLIMYFAMLLIISSGWHWLFGLLGKLFNLMVGLLNKIVLTIEGLPYALSKDIYISWPDIFLLYVLICFLTFYWIRKQAVYLIWSLVIICLMLLSSLGKELNATIKKEVIVYHEHNNSVIQFRNGNNSLWLVKENNSRLKSYIERAEGAMYSKQNKIVLMDSAIRQSYQKGISFNNGLWIRGNFIQFDTTRFFIMSCPGYPDNLKYNVPVDYVIIRKPCKNLNTIPYTVTSKVIIDASNTKYQANTIEKELLKKHINSYNSQNTGALRIEM